MLSTSSSLIIILMHKLCISQFLGYYCRYLLQTEKTGRQSSKDFDCCPNFSIYNSPKVLFSCNICYYLRLLQNLEKGNPKHLEQITMKELLTK